MSRHILPLVHRTSAFIAFVLLLTFWGSTAISELLQNTTAIMWVKTAIPFGFIVLIPALMLAGITGMTMANNPTNPILIKKKKRMPFIALNGIFILIPCALFLSYLAQNGRFSGFFISVQCVELLFGAINITLIALNIRAGIKIAHIIKQAKANKKQNS